MFSVKLFGLASVSVSKYPRSEVGDKFTNIRK